VEELEWFAGRLKELRERAGLTQPELAQRADMNRFGIAKLEQGVTKPTWETVLTLAKVLGVSCEAFTHPPADRKPSGPGRPALSREVAAEARPKRPRGRPRKEAEDARPRRRSDK
jgi:DNA-binding XRE family transcriptional regulator